MASNAKRRGARSNAWKTSFAVWPGESHRSKSMLSQAQRTTILELSVQGVSQHEIARMLGISRPTVRKVVRSNSTEVPEIARAEKAEPYRQRILELFSACKENLVRVHEELTAEGAALSYPALTAFCRKQGIGQAPIAAAGQYHFEPGEEMQHDTSPHEVQLAGKKRKVQTASGVLCYSRMLFFQCYPTFQRFDCKVFLTDAVRYARSLVSHARIADAEHQRIMLAEHRPPRGQGGERPDPHPEEKAILEVAPEMADYVAAMKQRGRKAPTFALRQLLRLIKEYPREPLLAAMRGAAHYGLYDLDRLERMILRRVVRDYFLLDDGSHDD